LTNIIDSQRLNSRWYQKKIARLIVAGIKNVLSE